MSEFHLADHIFCVRLYEFLLSIFVHITCSALGKFYFDQGDLRTAMRHYLDALATKPLMPAVWFRVGTIGMQLKEWVSLRFFVDIGIVGHL